MKNLTVRRPSIIDELPKFLQLADAIGPSPYPQQPATAVPNTSFILQRIEDAKHRSDLLSSARKEKLKSSHQGRGVQFRKNPSTDSLTSQQFVNSYTGQVDI